MAGGGGGWQAFTYAKPLLVDPGTGIQVDFLTAFGNWYFDRALLSSAVLVDDCCSAGGAVDFNPTC